MSHDIKWKLYLIRVWLGKSVLLAIWNVCCMAINVWVENSKAGPRKKLHKSATKWNRLQEKNEPNVVVFESIGSFMQLLSFCRCIIVMSHSCILCIHPTNTRNGIKWFRLFFQMVTDFFSLRKLTGKWHQWIKNITFYPFELWTVPYDVVVNRLFSLIFLYSTFSWFIDSVQWCMSCFYHDLALSFWTED